MSQVLPSGNTKIICSVFLNVNFLQDLNKQSADFSNEWLKDNLMIVALRSTEAFIQKVIDRLRILPGVWSPR